MNHQTTNNFCQENEPGALAPDDASHSLQNAVLQLNILNKKIEFHNFTLCMGLPIVFLSSLIVLFTSPAPWNIALWLLYLICASYAYALSFRTYKFLTRAKCTPQNYFDILETLSEVDEIRLLLPLARTVYILQVSSSLEKNGVICNQFNFNQKELAKIETKIIAILHSVTENDSGVLTNKEQELLWNLAFDKAIDQERYFSFDYALALLPALTKIGNEEMFQNMRQLAYRLNSRCEAQEQLVYELARQQLPDMKRRLQQQSKLETLLRPSMLPVSSDVLLRPADGTKSVAPEEMLQLLHPASDSSMASSGQRDRMK